MNVVPPAACVTVDVVVVVELTAGAQLQSEQSHGQPVAAVAGTSVTTSLQPSTPQTICVRRTVLTGWIFFAAMIIGLAFKSARLSGATLIVSVLPSSVATTMATIRAYWPASAFFA